MRAICCFAGHSELYDTGEIYKHLLSVIEDLITAENICEFWVGNYGAFDKLSAKAVRELKVIISSTLLINSGRRNFDSAFIVLSLSILPS